MCQAEFNFPTHQRENNAESEQTLAICNKTFRGHNKIIFERLMGGDKIDFSIAVNEYNITALPRRIADLVLVMKYQLSRGFIEGTRKKYYYMTPEQIEFNKLKQKQNGN